MQKNAKEIYGTNAQFVDIAESIKETIFISDSLKKNNNSNEFQADSYDGTTKIPEKGYIFAPITGSKTMYERRERAYREINNFRNPMPTLKTIIAGGKNIVQSIGKIHKAVNFKLSKKVFGKSKILFTERQKEAINVAINTPDIAIIQGPPGTGKTTVIKAIVERLNEIYKDSKLKILISSTQHDAVSNAISEMECGGLPPYRLGKKQNSISQNLYLEDWIQKIDNICDKFLENDNDSKERFNLRRSYYLIENLLKADIENLTYCQNLLGELYNELQNLNFPDEILNDVETVIKKLLNFNNKDSDDDEDLFLKQLLDMQRTDPIRFGDDGKKNLLRLKMYLSMNEQINFEVPETWEKLLIFKSVKDIPAELFTEFENSLIILREKVFGKPVTDSPELLKKDVTDLLNRVKVSLDSYGKTFVRSIYDVIYEFRDMLQSPGRVENLIAKYTKIIASTCQQSVLRVSNNSYIDEKNKRVYDYVIIDEAARSNPLDLLIPMSLGRIIILVGDQKQLPPMLEEDVVRKMFDGESLSSQELREKRKLLEEPLFQRLYNRLRLDLDIKRVVMLRDQYRMHPVIGNFVSDNFYGGELKSNFPKDSKNHNLKIYNNSAVAWIDIGKNWGLEESIGSGKFRTAEINCVFKEVEKILSLNENYTVGVITFYKMQEEKLRSYFDNLPYRKRIRLQVGTVDAFQGKEFDVVILSTVRCNKNKDLRARTGFVSSMNRLCVAFSRAKRLLVVVGDSETVARENGKNYIKTFANFYDLCLKDGYFEQYSDQYYNLYSKEGYFEQYSE